MNGGKTRNNRSALAILRTYIIPALLLLTVCYTFTSTGTGLFIIGSEQFTYQNELNKLYTAPPEIDQILPNNNATTSESDTIRTTFNQSETYLTMFGAHKVQESLARLPKWLQDYIEWHAEQRKKPVSECKFLVIPCFYGNKCGGTSDRLRPLPYWLLLAKLTERVLIIKWNKPHDLHEFLVPPPGGLDWRSFPELDERVIYGKPLRRQHKLRLFWAGSACGEDYSLANCTITKTVPRIREENHTQFVIVSFPGNQPHQSVNEGNMLAQQFSFESEMPEISQWGYAEMFGDIFRVMFEPVPAIAYQINRTMASLELKEGEYISTHVRARYPAASMPLSRKEMDTFDKDGGFIFEGMLKSYVLKISKNAIDCGKILAPDLPILFVSDSHNLSRHMAREEKMNSRDGKELKIVAADRSEEPLHIDRNDGWPGSKPSDFFSVFEDLLMMGGSKCVAHGIGSFGSFGSGLIGNKCRAIHRKYTGRQILCPNDRGIPLLIPTDPTLAKYAMSEYA